MMGREEMKYLCNGLPIPKYCHFCARVSRYHVDVRYLCVALCARDECWETAREKARELSSLPKPKLRK